MPDTDTSMLTDLNAVPANVEQGAVATATEPKRTQLTVKFWGVRGSVPTPGADTVRYGGNTACVEVLLAGHRLVFDGGTGLRVLGKHLLASPHSVTAHIFFYSYPLGSYPGVSIFWAGLYRGQSF